MNYNYDEENLEVQEKLVKAARDAIGVSKIEVNIERSWANYYSLSDKLLRTAVSDPGNDIKIELYNICMLAAKPEPMGWFWVRAANRRLDRLTSICLGR